jgi:hypothetical protein
MTPSGAKLAATMITTATTMTLTFLRPQPRSLRPLPRLARPRQGRPCGWLPVRGIAVARSMDELEAKFDRAMTELKEVFIDLEGDQDGEG